MDHIYMHKIFWYESKIGCFFMYSFIQLLTLHSDNLKPAVHHGTKCLRACFSALKVLLLTFNVGSDSRI